MSKWEEPKDYERKKVKRKRKPMSPEQKAAAVERLRKAREARGPSQNLSIHESIRELPYDHFISPGKVKEWLKIWKEKFSNMKSYQQSSDKKLRQEYYSTETYIKNMQSYLSTGIWGDMWYGENREHKIRNVVVAMAYDEEGNVKRNKGHFYPDWGIYGEEEECEWMD